MKDEPTRPPEPGSPEGTPADAGSLALARSRARFGIWLLLSLPLLVAAGVFAFLVLTHRAVPAPEWLVARIEARANTALAGRLQVQIGGIDVIVDEGFVPRVRMKVVQVARASGLPLAVLPELRTTLRAQPLLRGKVELRAFRIRGASLALRRLEDGRIDLDLGGAGGDLGFRFDSPRAAVEAFEAAFETPVLSRLEEIVAEGVQLRLTDERLDRVWQVSSGRFRLSQTDDQIAVTLSLEVGAQNAAPAQIALTATTRKDSPAASFGVAVTDMPAADLAVQSPALAMLGLLDAPISGALRSGLDDNGELQAMAGVLEVGAGAISPAEGAPPVPFEGAKVRLAYDRATQQVSFSDLSFSSRALRFQADGQTLLRDFHRGLPGAAVTQIAIRDLQLDPEGVFEKPAQISQGLADLRIQFKPFRIELGQLQLIEGERRISGRGAVSADAAGWHVAFDAAINRISQPDLLALWPPALVPPTRKWVADNVVTGELHNMRVALRLEPGTEPRLALGYEFRGAEVTVIRSLPPVREGRGFATIHENRHALMVEEGHVIPPEGGQIEVADTTLVVPDIRVKFAPMVVRLLTRSPIRAALSLLDQPPFEFLKKAGKTADIATGWAEAQTVLNMRLKPKLTPEDVDFDVVARLTDVRSDKVVPGHVLAADRLMLNADRTGLVLSGKGDLSGVTFDARWSQRFGPEHKGISAVNGYVEITPDALETFNIALPKGAVAGTGWGHLVLELREGTPPGYFLETDLRGLALKIPEIGWSKAAASKGNLQVAGALGAPVRVDRIALRAPGLAAEGKLSLQAGGGFERASVGSVQIGDWFSGAVDLVGRGANRAPDIEVSGGWLDLRRADLGKGARGGGAGGGKIRAALDRVTVSDGIALTGMRGNFGTRGGFNGTFTARVNGTAPISGAVGPADNGRTAVRINAEDAGAVLAATGIFSKARGGALDLTLSPVGDQSYEGRARTTNLRVKDAPVLASMLSAASIIGLLEQLNGEGILFTEAEAQFRLTPEGVSLTRGQAIGASMGVTMTGNYLPGMGTLDMEGVISPFYLINGIGQIFARRGEGLFGFTYTLRGAVASPKVVINPLSIFTPGMFREIFRRNPPKLVTE